MNELNSSDRETIYEESDQGEDSQNLDSAAHFFYNPFERWRKHLPELLQPHIEHIPEGRNGAARTISYTAFLLLLIDAQFGPIGRKDRLLHAAILVARIEMWFSNPKFAEAGFYKFIDTIPTESRFYDRSYKPGDSWCEELGFSPRMFDAAFELVGTTYKSLRQFRFAWEAKEEFFDDDGVERLYCAAHDNQKGYTVFFRNHPLADRLFKPLQPPPKKDGGG